MVTLARIAAHALADGLEAELEATGHGRTGPEAAPVVGVMVSVEVLRAIIAALRGRHD